MADDDTDDTTSRRGPLTPAELETLAELYGASGNASEVAEQLGVSVSTVTRALARLGAQNRAKLQERALSRGLLRGGELLTQTAESIAEILRCEAESGPSLEAKDYAGLARALAMCVGTTAKLDEREERRRQARLTRKKTKAETEVLRRKAEEIPALQVLLEKLSGDQILALLRGLTVEQLRALLSQTASPDAAAAAAEVTPGEG